MGINKRKGISPIIAVLLLILIAIAAGVMVYAFVAGWVGSATTTTTVAQGQLSIDVADANATAGNITVYVRNIGGVTVTIKSIYVVEAGGGIISWRNVTTGLDTYTVADLTIKVAPGEVKKFDINFGNNVLKDGYLYTIKLVGEDGTAYVFSVKAHS